MSRKMKNLTITLPEEEYLELKKLVETPPETTMSHWILSKIQPYLSNMHKDYMAVSRIGQNDPSINGVPVAKITWLNLDGRPQEMDVVHYIMTKNDFNNPKFAGAVDSLNPSIQKAFFFPYNDFWVYRGYRFGENVHGYYNAARSVNDLFIGYKSKYNDDSAKFDLKKLDMITPILRYKNTNQYVCLIRTMDGGHSYSFGEIDLFTAMDNNAIHLENDKSGCPRAFNSLQEAKKALEQSIAQRLSGLGMSG